MKDVFKKLLGYCEHCNSYFKYPKRYRMNTNYEDEESNYTILCKDCEAECDTYWEEQWRDVYGWY